MIFYTCLINANNENGVRYRECEISSSVMCRSAIDFAFSSDEIDAIFKLHVRQDMMVPVHLTSPDGVEKDCSVFIRRIA